MEGFTDVSQKGSPEQLLVIYSSAEISFSIDYWSLITESCCVAVLVNQCCAGWGAGWALLRLLCAVPAWLCRAVAASASLPLATPSLPSASGTPWATGSRAWPSACTGTSARSRTTSPWKKRSSECPHPAGLGQWSVAGSLLSARILELSLWAPPQTCLVVVVSIPQLLWLDRVCVPSCPPRVGVEVLIQCEFPSKWAVWEWIIPGWYQQPHLQIWL